jgi:hypothetical protein
VPCPAGLPSVTIGWWVPLYDVGQQMLLAVLICFIDICESISIAKALAQVRCSTVGYGVVRHGTMLSGTVRSGTV